MVADMAAALDPGIVASTGPRYYGFVIGGALPAAIGSDLLTTAWNQNGALHALSPAAAAAEEIAGEWMLDLLGLPADASVGLPTGAGLGNAVGMAAARHRLLQRAGWDVEAAGLYGAPEIVVMIGDEAHATVLTALQYLGFGRERVTRIAADEQGRCGSTPCGRPSGRWTHRRRCWSSRRPATSTPAASTRGRDGGPAGCAPQRLAARRRRVRPVGRRLPRPPPPGGRRGEGRLLVDRCAQSG